MIWKTEERFLSTDNKCKSDVNQALPMLTIKKLVK